MGKGQKVIIIGLDGGTLNLMNPWMEEGELPNFSKIKKKGVYGKLRSTTPCYSAPAWVSISTGVQPGKHGIYDFFPTDSLKKKIINSRYRKTPAIWNVLTDEGKKSIIVNIPGTYPPEKINGVMITGLLTPSEESDFTYPKEVKNNLTKDKLGKYELEQVVVDDIPKGLTAKYAPEKLAEQVNMITISHATVTMNLMQKYEWDLAMVVFRGTDDAQHLLWDRKDLILSCYKKADEYLGKFMEKYPDALFIIVSDHGFGQPEKYVYLNNALYNAGYLKTTSDPARGFNAFFTSMFDTFSKFIFHLLPIKKLVRTQIGRKIIQSSGVKSNIDFSKTKALYHSVCSRGIRINLKDKYIEGIVDKKDYTKVRSDLIGFLNNLKDPETGENIVETIYTSEEIYGKNAVNDPLDLIFDLKEGYGAQELIQPVGGMKAFLNWNAGLSIISPPGFYDWVGDHSQYGIIFMYGKNIKAGKKIDASVVDIVPTVLSALGIAIPSYIDGKTLNDAFVKKPKVEIIEKKEKILTKSEFDKIKKFRLILKKNKIKVK